jgi:hypothetical protein
MGILRKDPLTGSSAQKILTIGGRAFAVIGVLASIIGVWQFVSEQFYGKRSINALYRYSIVAEPERPFDLTDFVIQELKPYNRIAIFRVVVWNAGRESLSAADIRRPVLFEFDEGSRVISSKLGQIKSAENDNFSVIPSVSTNQDQRLFQLGWKFFDPGDYVEVVFLLATNKRRPELSNLLRVSGAISGGVFIEGQRFEARKNVRDLIIWPIVLLVMGLTIVGLFTAYGAIVSNLKGRRREKNRFVTSLMKVLVFCISVSIGFFAFVIITLVMFRLVLPNPLWDV